MFYSLSKLDKQTINIITIYYSNVYPDIPYTILYERIYCGYCWGEGGSRIISIEDWYEVFNYTKYGRMLFTLFENWEDYNFHKGDFHLKDKRFKKKSNRNHNGQHTLC